MRRKLDKQKVDNIRYELWAICETINTVGIAGLFKRLSATEEFTRTSEPIAHDIMHLNTANAPYSRRFWRKIDNKRAKDDRQVFNEAGDPIKTATLRRLMDLPFIAYDIMDEKFKDNPDWGFIDEHCEKILAKAARVAEDPLVKEGSQLRQFTNIIYMMCNEGLQFNEAAQQIAKELNGNKEGNKLNLDYNVLSYNDHPKLAEQEDYPLLYVAQITPNQYTPSRSA